MFEFLAEAVLLVGLLNYARQWRTPPDEAEPPTEDGERRDRRPSERMSETSARRPKTAAPPPRDSAPRPRTARDEARKAAKKAWSRLDDWLQTGKEFVRPRAEKRSPGRSARAKHTASRQRSRRPQPAAGSGLDRPLERSQEPPSAPSGAQARPPSMVRDPVCGVMVPWTRAVSLPVGSERRYFCSEACRSIYRKRLKHE